VLAAMPELQLQIVEFAREHSRVTIGAVIKLTGASRNTLKRHFRTLVERGTLNQHGSGRGVWHDLRWTAAERGFDTVPGIALASRRCIQRMHLETLKMAMPTVRHIREEVHRALRVRAAQHGRSMEAEVREILESALSPEGRVKLGSLLADIGRRAKLKDEEFAVFERVRDKTPARPASFE